MMMKPRIITNNATRPHTNKREHTENVLALFFVFKSTRHLSRVKNYKKVSVKTTSFQWVALRFLFAVQ